MWRQIFLFFFSLILEEAKSQIPVTSATWKVLSPDGTIWSGRNIHSLGLLMILRLFLLYLSPSLPRCPLPSEDWT
jgi:hypothetical protein